MMQIGELGYCLEKKLDEVEKQQQGCEKTGYGISSFADSGMFKKVFVPHHLNVTDTLSKLFK